MRWQKSNSDIAHHLLLHIILPNASHITQFSTSRFPSSSSPSHFLPPPSPPNLSLIPSLPPLCLYSFSHLLFLCFCSNIHHLYLFCTSPLSYKTHFLDNYNTCQDFHSSSISFPLPETRIKILMEDFLPWVWKFFLQCTLCRDREAQKISLSRNKFSFLGIVMLFLRITFSGIIF